MKANKKQLLSDDNAFNPQVVSGFVVLLISIIVGILIFWSLSGGMPLTDTQTETVTTDITGTAFSLPTNGDSDDGSNASAWAIQTLYLPSSTTGVNVTCYNSTGTSESYPTFTLSNRRIDVSADVADGFNQVNLSYTTKFSTEKTGTETMASTVFALLPIIALVLVAGIILAVVMGFGKKQGGTL